MLPFVAPRPSLDSEGDLLLERELETNAPPPPAPTHAPPVPPPTRIPTPVPASASAAALPGGGDGDPPGGNDEDSGAVPTVGDEDLSVLFSGALGVGGCAATLLVGFEIGAGKMPSMGSMWCLVLALLFSITVALVVLVTRLQARGGRRVAQLTYALARSAQVFVFCGAIALEIGVFMAVWSVAPEGERMMGTFLGPFLAFAIFFGLATIAVLACLLLGCCPQTSSTSTA